MGFFLNMLIFNIIAWVLWNLIKFIGSFSIPVWRMFSKFINYSIYFHEYSHYIMLKLLLVKVSLKDIHFAYTGGYVNYRNSDDLKQRTSFVKFTLVAFAPVIFGTLSIMFILERLGAFEGIFIAVLKYFICFVIIIGIGPSKGDLKTIIFSIKERPGVFVKELIFITFSYLIYLLNFEFFSQYIEVLRYLFEFITILAIFSLQELIFIIIKGFILQKINKNKFAKLSKYSLNSPTNKFSIDRIKHEIFSKDSTHISGEVIDYQKELEELIKKEFK